IAVRAAAVAGSLLLPAVAPAHAGLAAQDSSFVLATADPGYRTPPFLGNGAFSLVGTPLGTAAAPSFAAGVYDHAPGDVARIAALPAWNAVDWFDGAHWLDAAPPDRARLRDYRQTLDLRDGVLETRYDWDDAGRRTSVLVRAFVSRADPRLAVILVRVRSGLEGRAPPRRLPLARLTALSPAWTQADLWYPGYLEVVARGARSRGPRPEAWLVARAAGGSTRVAEAAVTLAGGSGAG